MAIGFPATLNRERTRVVQAPNIPFMENLPVCEYLKNALGDGVLNMKDFPLDLLDELIRSHARKPLPWADLPLIYTEDELMCTSIFTNHWTTSVKYCTLSLLLSS